MFGQVANIAVLIVGGAMLANLVANPKGTKVLVDGVTGLWSTSMAALRS